MATASPRLGQAVEIHAEDGKIIIKPLLPPAYDLETLLDAMTPDSFHRVEDVAPPVGREIW